MGQAPVKGQVRFGPLASESQFEQCAELQKAVWGFTRSDLVSARMLATSQRYGGTLIGAFESPDSLVGFVFSFPALWREQRLEHSHMLAVLPRCQNRGIGSSLKQRQRKAVLQKEIELITWTFDPLVAKNAYINLQKLGVRVCRYYHNLYGESTSSKLHQLGTDRFLAEWKLAGGSSSRKKGRNGPLIIRVSESRRGLWPEARDVGRSDSLLLIEIPSDIQRLINDYPEAARRWRTTTREVFSHYLSQDYTVTGFERRKDTTGQLRTFYVIEHEEPDDATE